MFEDVKLYESTSNPRNPQNFFSAISVIPGRVGNNYKLIINTFYRYCQTTTVICFLLFNLIIIDILII